VTGVARWFRSEPPPAPPGSDPTLASLNREVSHEEVDRACGACHASPSPDLFPRDDWPREVSRGFEFLGKSRLPITAPPIAGVVAYFQNRAPVSLSALERPEPSSPCPVRFDRLILGGGPSPPAPGIANVRFVHLSDETRLDVVACDMIHGKIWRLKPYEPSPSLQLVTDVIPNPSHAEVVDLNKDGIKDLVVANLGTPVPSEQRLGSVVWLEGRADGSFNPVTLADEFGRVTDVQPADFDGDGDLDLIVAVFGRLELGEIVLLENRPTDKGRPAFVRTTVDPRHGTIQVPIADLDGDGRPDFVALISQEHETAVAFLNIGGGRFRSQVLYAAPHPAFGSSGIELMDLDGDGDLDLLMTNGDTLDAPLLRPYHGIRWLENRGSYPFRHHQLASLYGVHSAHTADFDGDGDLDIVASAFLPGPFYQPLRREKSLDSMVLLEQGPPGRFIYHSLETVACDHATCDVGDFDNDGNVDVVTGNCFMPVQEGSADSPAPADPVVVLKNLGPPGGKPGRR